MENRRVLETRFSFKTGGIPIQIVPAGVGSCIFTHTVGLDVTQDGTAPRRFSRPAVYFFKHAHKTQRRVASQLERRHSRNSRRAPRVIFRIDASTPRRADRRKARIRVCNTRCDRHFVLCRDSFVFLFFLTISFSSSLSFRRRVSLRCVRGFLTSFSQITLVIIKSFSFCLLDNYSFSLYYENRFGS